MSASDDAMSGVPSEQMTSPEMLRQAAQHDPDACRRLVEQHRRLVWSWCVAAGLQPADADDVLQDVLQAVFARLQTFERRSPGTSAAGCTRSLSRSWWISSERPNGGLRRSAARRFERAWSGSPLPNRRAVRRASTRRCKPSGGWPWKPANGFVGKSVKRPGRRIWLRKSKASRPKRLGKRWGSASMPCTSHAPAAVNCCKPLRNICPSRPITREGPLGS